MDELLVQWSRLEPSKCRLSDNFLTDNGYEICVSGNWFPIFDTSLNIEPANNLGGNLQDVLSRATRALICGAVQEAIEARGWHYEQRWSGTEKIGYVYPPDETVITMCSADNHAESLLRAYIEMQKRGSSNLLIGG